METWLFRQFDVGLVPFDKQLLLLLRRQQGQLIDALFGILYDTSQ